MTPLAIPEKIDLSVGPLVMELMNMAPHPSCEYNFVNLLCWEGVYRYSWFLHEGRLVIHDGKDHIMFMPLGPALDPEALNTLSARALDMGLSPDIFLASQDYIDQFPDLNRYYTITRDRDAAEYIYLAENLAELKGTKLHKKRNLISQFRRKYPDYRVLPITNENKSRVKGFTKDLLGISDPVPESLAQEFSAMDKAFDHWDELPLQGILVTAGDKIAAFSVFSPISQDTFNIHFEKSNLAFKGAAQVINRETAEFLKDRCRYINREQDLGIPGLRQAKLSYEPHPLLIPYTLKFKTKIKS